MAALSKIISNVLKLVDEPMVDDQMGAFNDIRIPVQHTNNPAYWGMPAADIPYVTAQTQDEHNRLLNTFYPQRKTLKNWKALGKAVEKKDPRYSDVDVTTRKPLGAKSSVIQDMAYDPNRELAMLMIGGKWYTYAATPEQFQQYLTAGSLGREMNNIKNGHSSSMSKTAIRKTPGSGTGSVGGALGRIASIFGF